MACAIHMQMESHTFISACMCVYISVSIYIPYQDKMPGASISATMSHQLLRHTPSRVPLLGRVQNEALECPASHIPHRSLGTAIAGCTCTVLESCWNGLCPVSSTLRDVAVIRTCHTCPSCLCFIFLLWPAVPTRQCDCPSTAPTGRGPGTMLSEFLLLGGIYSCYRKKIILPPPSFLAPTPLPPFPSLSPFLPFLGGSSVFFLQPRTLSSAIEKSYYPGLHLFFLD